MPKKDSRLLLAKFNEQMEKLYELLRAVEDIKLSPEVLEPDPVDLALGIQGGGSVRGPQSGDMSDGRWSGEARYNNPPLHSFHPFHPHGPSDQQVLIKNLLGRINV